MEMFFYQRPLFIFTIFFLSLNGVFGWGGVSNHLNAHLPSKHATVHTNTESAQIRSEVWTNAPVQSHVSFLLRVCRSSLS